MCTTYAYLKTSYIYSYYKHNKHTIELTGITHYFHYVFMQVGLSIYLFQYTYVKSNEKICCHFSDLET